jgi:uncharacterized protein YgbK (DUF1537 family)
MIYIIADDLTGACDTGACFAQHGLSTAVQIGLPAEDAPLMPTSDVLVFNTVSRALPEPLAIRAVQNVTRRIAQDEALIYKKIDSTLRGHPGAELHALMQALRVDRALVTPAFPAQGRTVLGGQVLVQGQPLGQTVFAGEGAVGDLQTVFAHPHHPLHMLTSDEVQQELPSTRARLSSPGISLADAQTDAHLRRLAQLARACGIRLLCGSAGLAMALAQQMTPADRPVAPLPSTPGATLGVAGSRNPSTAVQVRYASQHGIPILQPPPEWMDSADACPPAALIEALCTTLAGEGRAILSTCNLPESDLGRKAVAQRLGEIVAQVARRVTLQRLVLTGGDVAMAVCTALGAHWLALYGEAQPGIALGRLADSPYEGVSIITKAGGFGAEDALMKCLLEGSR